ncbi:MAG: hypothetical protein QXL96_06735 [Ignisphaera sp.]
MIVVGLIMVLFIGLPIKNLAKAILYGLTYAILFTFILILTLMSTAYAFI